MKNINFSEENRIVLAGDLNVFIVSKLETKGGKPSLKQKSLAKLLELKEEYEFKNFLMAQTLFQLLKPIILLF